MSEEDRELQITQAAGWALDLMKGSATNGTPTAIVVERLEDIPANANPYRHDDFRQGMNLSEDIHVMYYIASSPERGPGLSDIVVIRRSTGERTLIRLGQIFQSWADEEIPKEKA